MRQASGGAQNLFPMNLSLPSDQLFSLLTASLPPPLSGKARPRALLSPGEQELLLPKQHRAGGPAALCLERVQIHLLSRELAQRALCVSECVTASLLTRVGLGAMLAVAYDTAQAHAGRSNTRSSALYPSTAGTPRNAPVAAQAAPRAEVRQEMEDEAELPFDSTIPHLGLVIHW